MVLSFISSSSIKNKEHQKSLIIIRIGLIFHLSIILIGSEFHNIYMIVKDLKNQDNLFFFFIQVSLKFVVKISTWEHESCTNCNMTKLVFPACFL